MDKIQMLVADDSKIELDCVLHLTNRFNLPFDITTALNGKEALGLLKNVSIDLLLTDIKMPFLDGLSLSKEALKLNEKLKIIIFSSFGEFEYAKTAMALGVQDYLLKPINPDEFNEVMSRVGNVVQKGKQEEKHRIEKNFSSLIDIPSPDSTDEKTSQYKSRVEIIKDYIDQYYYKDLSLEELGKIIFVHPDYLCRIFKKETGENINKYIKKTRMAKAKEMLLHTPMKVVDICQTVGYNNLSYFCQVFREYFGNTPEYFRRRGHQV